MLSKSRLTIWCLPKDWLPPTGFANSPETHYSHMPASQPTKKNRTQKNIEFAIFISQEIIVDVTINTQIYILKKMQIEQQKLST